MRCECPCDCPAEGEKGREGFDDDALCEYCYADLRECQVALEQFEMATRRVG